MDKWLESVLDPEKDDDDYEAIERTYDYLNEDVYKGRGYGRGLVMTPTEEPRAPGYNSATPEPINNVQEPLSTELAETPESKRIERELHDKIIVPHSKPIKDRVDNIVRKEITAIMRMSGINRGAYYNNEGGGKLEEIESTCDNKPCIPVLQTIHKQPPSLEKPRNENGKKSYAGVVQPNSKSPSNCKSGKLPTPTFKILWPSLIKTHHRKTAEIPKSNLKIPEELKDDPINNSTKDTISRDISEPSNIQVRHSLSVNNYSNEVDDSADCVQDDSMSTDKLNSNNKIHNIDIPGPEQILQPHDAIDHTLNPTNKVLEWLNEKQGTLKKDKHKRSQVPLYGRNYIEAVKIHNILSDDSAFDFHPAPNMINTPELNNDATDQNMYSYDHPVKVGNGTSHDCYDKDSDHDCSSGGKSIGSFYDVRPGSPSNSNLLNDDIYLPPEEVYKLNRFADKSTIS